MTSQLSENAWIALGLIIILVFTINLGLWAAWKRRNAQNQDDWLHRIGKTVRQPWHTEDEQLQTLSQQVNKLRPPGSQEPENPPTPTAGEADDERQSRT